MKLLIIKSLSELTGPDDPNCAVTRYPVQTSKESKFLYVKPNIKKVTIEYRKTFPTFLKYFMYQIKN